MIAVRDRDLGLVHPHWNVQLIASRERRQVYILLLSTEGTARDNSFLHQDVERCVGHLLLAVTGRLLTGPANDRLPHYRGYLTVP